MNDKKDSNIASYVDKEGMHEKLSKHCEDNGLKIGFVYAKLIKKYLKDPDIIKS